MSAHACCADRRCALAQMQLARVRMELSRDAAAFLDMVDTHHLQLDFGTSNFCRRISDSVIPAATLKARLNG